MTTSQSISTRRNRRIATRSLFLLCCCLQLKQTSSFFVPTFKHGRKIQFKRFMHASCINHVMQQQLAELADTSHLPSVSSRLQEYALSSQSSSITSPSPTLLLAQFHVPIIIPSFISNWLSSPVTLLATVVVVIVALAILQGATAMSRFRSNFAHVPLPQVPAHGLVIVQKQEQQMQQLQSSTSEYDIDQDQQVDLERYYSNDSSHYTYNNNDSHSTPLKLLLIGDSLAVGVGQSRECTPVLPQFISHELSKRTQKPVFWTVHGESGASTRWILKLLSQNMAANKTSSTNATDSGNGNGYDDYVADGELVTRSSNNDGGSNEDILQHYKKQLHQYQTAFDPQSLGTYDIVVILTGANDLKSMLLPFLLLEDDRELLKQSKDQKGGLIQDLQNLIQYLTNSAQESMRRMNEQMEERIQESLASIRESADIVTALLSLEPPAANHDNAQQPNDVATMIRWRLENLTASVSELLEDRAWLALAGPKQKQLLASATNSSAVDIRTTSNNSSTSGVEKNNEDDYNGDDDNNDNTMEQSPPSTLFVLPGMPARALPIFQRKPLGWFAVPIVNGMNRKKRKLAQADENDEQLLFVSDPKLDELVDYEQHRGDVWESGKHENVLLSLRAVSRQDCDQVTFGMAEHYDKHVDAASDHISKQPGISLFSPDRIHPNEQGYEFWGRSIGMEIAASYKAAEAENRHET
ncbi:hypothetical protein MPSEU_000553500 [Mayamaea pseudoterrestris]|nr:hypothetical protein MPSEU_000553500 [Mayamaea pseudoterrestris]